MVQEKNPPAHKVSPTPFVIEAKKLVKRFGTHTVVNHIDLCVPRGGCFGLLGPNGAGKTTTLRMLLGHSPPTSGQLMVLGEPMPEGGSASSCAHWGGVSGG